MHNGSFYGPTVYTVYVCVYKVQHAIRFASRASIRLPEGAKGDMCRTVQNDVDFGRWFLTGPNPVMLRRCTHIPTEKFPVTDDMIVGLLDRTKRLEDEAQVSQPTVAIRSCIFLRQS